MREMVLVIILLLSGAGGFIRAGAATDSSTSRWEPIGQVFGQKGEAADGYFRINLPRTDLDVHIGDVALDPGFDLTTYFGFVPRGRAAHG